jgi:hypothetical protein
LPPLFRYFACHFFAAELSRLSFIFAHAVSLPFAGHFAADTPDCRLFTAFFSWLSTCFFAHFFAFAFFFFIISFSSYAASAFRAIFSAVLPR